MKARADEYGRDWKVCRSSKVWNQGSIDDALYGETESRNEIQIEKRKGLFVMK
jgi:hypothetical protein